MTVGSLFSGFGGFDIAAEKAGMETAWLCEIDRNAQAILRRHFPNAPLHSDVRHVGAHNLEPVDIVVFGSPCQDLSVAGKRGGMAGDRSGLFHEAIRIIRELRERDGRLRWAIWENVPGAFSSHGGRDFAAVLDAFLDIGARDIAWRVLDAQWHGVAQRRERVFLVADFGGECAEAVLSVRESLSWNPPARRTAGQVAAAIPASGAGTSRTGNERTEPHLMIPVFDMQGGKGQGRGTYTFASPCLGTTDGGHAVGVPTVAYSLTARSAQNRSESSAATKVAAEPELSGSLGSHSSGGWGNDLDNQGAFIPVARCLTSRNERIDAETETLIAFTQEETPKQSSSAVPALDAKGCRRPSIAMRLREGCEGGGKGPLVSEELSLTFASATNDQVIVPASMSVRRLTPTECCRLMALPDDWLDWGLDVNGNRVQMSDSAKYRMAGNGLVWTCVLPILERIAAL